MNRELFKTILLLVLVLSSVAMTWNILFYRSDFESYKSPSGAAKTVAISETGARSASSVVSPMLFLQHSQTGTFGQSQLNPIQEAYTLMQRATFNNLVPVAYRSQVPARANGPSYELIFPAPLMRDTLKKFFRFSERTTSIPSDVLIDRIEIYSAEKGGMIALFSSQDGQNQFFATVSQLNMNALKHAFSPKNSTAYISQHLDGKIVYLPDQKTELPTVMFYYNLKKLDAFLPILFNDSEENVFHTRGKALYTDGQSQLEQTGDVLQYVNVNPGISDTQQLTDPIFHSYDLLNNFKEWTDDYRYAGVDLSKNRKTETVVFRMRIGNYMAFNTDYYPNPFLTQIQLTWKNGQLSNFNRTLLDLNPIDQPGSVTLDSGKLILQQLKLAGVPIHRIQDLTIGYQLESPKSSSDYSIAATPDWFYMLDNHWYAASDTINQKGSFSKERRSS
ncbi:MAG: two-component system activity regulator YycH [Sporolactobacillus sp.]